MNGIFCDLSGRIDEPDLINALLEIKNIADKLNLDYFVVGAIARDILMEHIYGIAAPRITKDLDIAVCTSNWGEIRALTDALLARGTFSKLDQRQRFSFKGKAIDIVPFGDIAGPQNRISWPPGNDTIMSTIGFDDVYKNSIIVRLSDDPVLEVKIPTVPGLAVLKLLAWSDGYPNRSKDAEDLLFIMRRYQSAGIEDRLYEQEGDLLIEEEFDNERAGIRLLGRDMARLANTDASKAIADILNIETGETSKFRLIPQMGGPQSAPDFIMALLEKLKQGFLEELLFKAEKPFG